MSQKIIKVFYSWQSDLPRETNNNLIRNIFNEVKSEIEAQHADIVIQLDEATRNESGTPDITSTILRKIDECDFYIADVSIVGKLDRNQKNVPNANVLIEFGYALKILGYERITLLFNQAYGKINNLPFDLDRRKITTFTSTTENPRNHNLKNIFTNVINDYIRKNETLRQPIRVVDLYERDLNTLTKIFKYIDIPTFRTLSDTDTNYRASYLFFLKDKLNYLINIEYFHISSEYGMNLKELLKKFISLFSEITTLISWKCFPDSRGNDIVNYIDLIKNISSEEEECILRKFSTFENILNEILDIIERNYGTNFNISEFSESARNAYQAYKQEYNDYLEELPKNNL